jgi:hypothetical protein
MERSLTTMKPPTTIPLADETEASSAEEHLARDNQPGVTDYRWGGPFRTVRPILLPKSVIQNSPMPKKTLPCRRQGILLTVKRICPFHAEPVHG